MLILYAYLNIEHPLVAWEVAIGRVQSVDELSDRFGISLWAYSLLQSYVQKKSLQRFRNELRLEQIRLNNYPSKVSRLQGLYFFKSEHDARAALERWGMPEKKQYISEVTFHPTRLTELDSEWITSNLGRDGDSAWMNSYWSGYTAGDTPLTEILGSGTGVVENKDLRARAYRRIYDLWPTSTPLLAAACCAFSRGLRDVAVVKPGLLSRDDKITGGFFIFMKQFDEKQSEVVVAVEEGKKTGECPPIIMPSDQKKIFRLPDLRPYSFELINADLLAELTSIYHKKEK